MNNNKLSMVNRCIKPISKSLLIFMIQQGFHNPKHATTIHYNSIEQKPSKILSWWLIITILVIITLLETHKPPTKSRKYKRKQWKFSQAWLT